MVKITVGVTATLLVAADADRGSVTVQHIDVAQGGVRVWVAPAAGVTVGGDAMVLTGVGVSMGIARADGAASAWYAIAEEAGVDVMVHAAKMWDSRA